MITGEFQTDLSSTLTAEGERKRTSHLTGLVPAWLARSMAYNSKRQLCMGPKCQPDSAYPRIEEISIAIDLLVGFRRGPDALVHVRAVELDARVCERQRYMIPTPGGCIRRHS